MGTVIVLLILAVAVLAAAKHLFGGKKNGRSVSCGGDCGNCKGCHH